ncbi:hypothetical protein [Pseudomonas brenneri]|uniref:hypothetical protein n=1 Tax=Pseudomonas brenneri TaxID=129817 RepID=UPI0028D0650A|nr:hypothetical protein [Pseudomonas brenneri]
MSNAYDSKNEENFEAGSRAIDAALEKISKDPSIPATITHLAKIAGVHRNTLYFRQWPKARIEEIKAKRAQQKKDHAAAKAASGSPEEQLERSRLEIIYWFTQLQDARADNASHARTIKQTAAARDYYKEENQILLHKINELRLENQQLHNMVDVLEQEIASGQRQPDQ